MRTSKVYMLTDIKPENYKILRYEEIMEVIYMDGTHGWYILKKKSI